MKDSRHVPKEAKTHLRGNIDQESDIRADVSLEDISNRLLKGLLPYEEEYFVCFPFDL